MNFCTNCGNKVDSNAYICVKCGVKLRNEEPVQVSSDTGSIGWTVLGFFVPLLGLILYLVWKDTNPQNAKAIGRGALIYAVVCVVICIFSYIFGFISGITDSVIEEDNYNNSYIFE